MPSGGGAISGIASIYSARQGAKSASKARGLQRDQLALEQQRDKFNKAQVQEMNRWAREEREDALARRERQRGLYDPMEEDVIATAMESPEEAVTRARARSDADVRQAFGVQRGIEARRRQRYGIRPESGRDLAMNRRMDAAEALATVYGRDVAQRTEEDRNWSRKIATLGMGNLKDTQISSSLAQLGQEGAPGVIGQMAGAEGRNAASAFALSGKLLGDSISAFRNAPSLTGGGGVTPPASGNWMDPYGEDAVN